MKKYTEAQTGKKVVEIYDLSFLKEKEHPYGWLRRHFLHFRMKFMLKRADIIYVQDATTGIDLVRYYFIPKDKIAINSEIKSSAHKA